MQKVLLGSQYQGRGDSLGSADTVPDYDHKND